MHPRNLHQGSYDLQLLAAAVPDLKQWLVQAKSGKETVNFHNPRAVVALNKALLQVHYGVTYWDVPAGYLCPPVPSRSDYLHHIADLLAADFGGMVPTGKGVLGVDIGTGASLIYPLLGHSLYQWQFLGTDIDAEAVKTATEIAAKNGISHSINVVQQRKTDGLFSCLPAQDYADFTMCNPPFHASAAEAEKANTRKRKGLGAKVDTALNFGGTSSELWTVGGELAFISSLIRLSAARPKQVLYYTSLVSKEANVGKLITTLKKYKPADIRVLGQQHGQKKSRILTWTFFAKKQRAAWANMRWNS